MGQRKTQISSKKICEIPDRIGQKSASSAKSACLYPKDRAGPKSVKICEICGTKISYSSITSKSSGTKILPLKFSAASRV